MENCSRLIEIIMPGYEVDRFINLSENDKAELTCSICQDIFCSPMVAECCLQTFCEDCIKEWVETNNTCPFDRKPLTKANLGRPPRYLRFFKIIKTFVEFNQGNDVHAEQTPNQMPVQ